MKHFKLYKKSNSASRIRDLHFKDADQNQASFVWGQNVLKETLNVKI